MKRQGGISAARVELIGASPEGCLSRMAEEGILFWDFQAVDELTVRVNVCAGDIPKIRRCGKKTMCSVEIVSLYGLVPRLRAMGMRILYLPVLLGLLLLVFWLQSHIWFFTVTGNETVPVEEILRVLEENGVGFWTSTDSLEMNSLKNRVLEDLPELGWITVNTEGPMAQVVVRERAEKPAISEDSTPANLVAKKAGVIESIDATGGTPVVKPGDIVAAGDLLISGVPNLDKTMLLTRAEGEVYANTWTRLTASMPETVARKSYTGRKFVGYRITFGKNTINFYKTSGISYGEYDKIMEQTRLTLPGGYQFPVTFTKCTFREYESEAAPLEEAEVQTRLEAAITAQLQLHLSAGSILDKQLSLSLEDGVYTLSGVVECREEIGSVAKIKD